jgi:hypothetical protein
MNHKHSSRFSSLSKSAKAALMVAVFLIIFVSADHIIFWKSSDVPKVSEMESRSPRTRLQEPHDNPTLRPAHGNEFRANLPSPMTSKALSEFLRAPRFLSSGEITSLIEKYGFEEIIIYLSSLPDQKEYHNDNYVSLRQHLAHLLLSSSIDEFVESIQILPELALQAGISPKLHAFELVYPERQLLERTREVGVNPDLFYAVGETYFTTLYDQVGSMAEVVKLVETTQNDQRALMESLKSVPISLLPSRTSDDGIVLFDFLEKVRTEDPLHYKQSGIEEALEQWLTTD